MVCLMYYIMYTYSYCFIGNSLCRNLCTLHVTRTRVVFIACLSFYSLFYDDQACVKGREKRSVDGWMRQSSAKGREEGTLSCAERETQRGDFYHVCDKKFA